jgi:hypothetical protein
MIGERIEIWLERLGDRVNPILVKETRQALKSRQFSGTFMLLLAASLVISFAGIALAGPDVDYRSAGAEFFVFYFSVLAFAVFVVVPYGAYRSLAAEHEERTFELLAITTLRPGQIVTGKLLSAVIQMFIYFSAIAPFMAFTYLLKGIDVASIFFVLAVSLLASIGFAMVGLFMATFANRKAMQVVLSVTMITGLGFATVGSIPLCAVIIGQLAGELRGREFWISMFCLFTGYATTFLVIFQLSIAQLTFESDNRSSKVRAAVVLQFLSFLAWVAWGWVVELGGEREYLIAMTIVGGMYLSTVGSFLAAEPPGLSRRVAREVPRSNTLRALATLLYPGTGTGLGLLLAMLFTLALSILLLEATEDFVVSNLQPGRGTRFMPTAMAAVIAAYVFFYVGLAALFCNFLRRFRPVPAVAGTAVAAILAAMGSLIPNFIQAFRRVPYQSYELWQISDPVMTLSEVWKLPAPDSPIVFIPLTLAGLVLLANLRHMARGVLDVEWAGRGVQPAAEAPPVTVLQPTDSVPAAEPAAGG